MAEERELKLYKRKSTAVFNTTKKDVFAPIDEYQQNFAADAVVNDADAADVVLKLTGLRTDLDKIEQQLKEFSDRICELLVDDDEFETIMNDDSSMIRKMSLYRAIIDDLIKRLKPKSVTSSDTMSATPTAANTTYVAETKAATRRAKPPDLTIPKFNGSYLEWDTFKETFDAIVGDKPGYSNVEKFQYLKSSLTGPAQTCVAGFPVVGANYVAAYELLKERFGNEH